MREDVRNGGVGCKRRVGSLDSFLELAYIFQFYSYFFICAANWNREWKNVNLIMLIFFFICFFWWHDANRPISVNLETACKSLFEVSASEYVCVCVYNGCMASVFFGEYEYECANIWRWRLVVAARFVVGDWLLAKSFWLTAKFTLMRLAGVRCILSAIFGVLYFNFFIFIFFGCFAAMKFSDCGSNGVVDVWFLKSPWICDVWVVYT